MESDDFDLGTPPDGQAIRGRRGLGIWLLAVAVVLLVGWAVTVVDARRREAERLRAKVAQTRTLVESVADREVQAIATTETYLDPATDAWGRRVQVRKQMGTWGVVEVVSGGPDGVFDDRRDPHAPTDDIVAHRRADLDWKRAGEAVGRRAGRFGVGVVKGLGHAAKEAIAGEDRR
jgi:hypothetical protein